MKNIFKWSGFVLVLVCAVFCISCAQVKCKAEQISCKWDCPETVGLKQACEQKCNFMYDVCKN